jgi:hypothetical protein
MEILLEVVLEREVHERAPVCGQLHRCRQPALHDREIAQRREVVGLVLDHVVKQHEICDHDLVHPAQRLEAVQVMFRGFGLKMARFVGQLSARRMDTLTARLEHSGDRMLRKPVNLKVGVQLAQLVGDRDIAVGMAKPDRRGDVERALAPHARSAPATRRRRRAGEIADHEICLDGVAEVWGVAAAVERHQPATRNRVRNCGTASRAHDRVLRPLNHERWAAHSRAETQRLLAIIGPLRLDAADDGLRICVQAPPDGILNLLGRMWLSERLREEELEKSRPVFKPVMAVPLRPALQVLWLLIERIGALLLGRIVGQQKVRCDQDKSRDAVWVLGGQDEIVPTAAPRDDNGQRLLDPARPTHLRPTHAGRKR